MIRAIILSMLPVVVFGAAVGYNKRTCYDVLIPECQGLGYIKTSLPARQQIQSVQKKINFFSKRSSTPAALVPYLCYTLVPSCQQDRKYEFTPCKAACQKLQGQIERLSIGVFYENSKEFHCESENFPKIAQKDRGCVTYQSLYKLGRLSQGEPTPAQNEKENRIIKTTQQSGNREQRLSDEHITSLEQSINELSKLVSLLTNSISKISGTSPWFNMGGGAESENKNLVSPTPITTTTTTATGVEYPDLELDEGDFGWSGSGSGERERYWYVYY